MKIILKGLPKISLNLFYSSSHWTKRKQIKDDYFWLVKSQTKHRQSKSCKVRYDFYFKGRLLDCSNCAGGMVKLIEDVIFPDDSPKIVKQIMVTSNKAKEDFVEINIEEL